MAIYDQCLSVPNILNMFHLVLHVHTFCFKRQKWILLLWLKHGQHKNILFTYSIDKLRLILHFSYYQTYINIGSYKSLWHHDFISFGSIFRSFTELSGRLTCILFEEPLLSIIGLKIHSFLFSSKFLSLFLFVL